MSRFRPPPLCLNVESRKRWLVTGATGFVGRRLTAALAAGGHDVTVVTRDIARTGDLCPPFRAVTCLDDIDGRTRFDVIVHLAGEPVAGGLWTRAKRHRIETSRPEMARRLIALIDRLETKPKVMVSASAVAWYGLRGDEVLDEQADFRDCFTHRTCAAAEAASTAAESRGLRVVMLRIGLVLGRDGGLLAQLLPIFDWGLGGTLGSGSQWMSWIERDDLVRLIARAATDETISGPLNAVAPYPVTNRSFAKALARALRRPALFGVPRAVLVGLLGDMARELVLASQRVVPAKALDRGFEFRHPRIDEALAKALS